MPRHPAVSPTVAGLEGSVYSSLARRAFARDGEVYPLHIGDTWLKPPLGCRMEDLSEADWPGLHRYAPVAGLPSLRDAIVERTGARTGSLVERDQVLVTAGATGGLGAAVGAIVDPGDEVLIVAPHWPLISGIVRSFRGTPVPVPLLGAVESPVEAMERLWKRSSRRTVALYLNTPNNPTGRVIPHAWLEAMIDWCRSRELWILADEVYEETLFEGEHLYTRPLAPERTVSVHSFSKAFGMAGNRCGYVVGPATVIRELKKISVHTFYSTPTAAQVAALQALDGRGDAWAADARELYRAAGRAAAARLGVEPPEGSTFLFLDLAAHLDEGGLGGLLTSAADRGLLLAPGPSFGPYPEHARLCFTSAPPDVVARGVQVLAELLGR